MVDEKSKKSETFQYATAYQASETVKLTDAQHKVYVKCEFPSKEILNSEKANFTVVSRPIITLASPAKNWYPDPDYNNSTATDDFSYNVYFYSLSPGASNTNTGVSSRSCKFVIDKALVERETVLDNYTNSEAIAVSSIPRFEGKHKWQVICTDTNGAVGKSEKRNFRHRQKITIVPVTQRNAQFNSADDIALKFNAISTKKLECRVTVDGVEGEKMKLKANTNSQKEFTYRTSVVYPTKPHTWNVFCKSGDNVVKSDTYSFTVGPL
ncbi:hypothetical protein FJZ26_03595 [Candidatus Parvarchaeota archaeon]|nr:hypothetical protein [Candidatus Parvarchaeota archaeon]